MLEDIRAQCLRLLSERAGAIEQALEEVLDKRLFVPVAPWTNSLGNLVLHVAGNLRTLIGRIGGGVPYERDRDREFSEGSLSRDEVLATLREAVEQARQVITGIDVETWRALPPDPVFEGESRGDHVLRSIEHLGYHAGQIVLTAKILELLTKE